MDFSEETLNDWISQAEAARLRGVSPQAIAGLIHRGHLSTMKFAGRVLVRRSEIEHYTPQRAGRPRISDTDEEETNQGADRA